MPTTTLFFWKILYMSWFDKKISNGCKLTRGWLFSLALRALYKSSPILPKMSPSPDKTGPPTVPGTRLLAHNSSHCSPSRRIVVLFSSCLLNIYYVLNEKWIIIILISHFRILRLREVKDLRSPSLVSRQVGIWIEVSTSGAQTFNHCTAISRIIWWWPQSSFSVACTMN